MNHTPLPNDRNRKACLRQVPGNKPVQVGREQRTLDQCLPSLQDHSHDSTPPHTRLHPHPHPRKIPFSSVLVGSLVLSALDRDPGVSSCHNDHLTPSPIKPATTCHHSPRLGRHTGSGHAGEGQARAESRPFSRVHKERITGHPGSGGPAPSLPASLTGTGGLDSCSWGHMSPAVHPPAQQWATCTTRS